MAPEILFPNPDRTYDGKVDVYALAVILYEMLQGQHPLTKA